MTSDKNETIVELRFPRALSPRAEMALVLRLGVYRGACVLERDGRIVGIQMPKWAFDDLRARTR